MGKLYLLPLLLLLLTRAAAFVGVLLTQVQRASTRVTNLVAVGADLCCRVVEHVHAAAVPQRSCAASSDHHQQQQRSGDCSGWPLHAKSHRNVVIIRFTSAGPSAAQHGCCEMLDSCWHACAWPASGRVISELGRALIIKPPGERCADEQVHVGLGSRIVARHPT